MAFPENFITELADRNDIVDVVSQYVRLSRKSGSNMFGLCPFHSEKTPSFSVSPDKQIYHCFGCGKGGGVINFIMEVENLSFGDAVEFLARRCGMTMPERENDFESKKRNKMLALNKAAARFFYEQLSTPMGAIARDYLVKRRIGPAVAKNFGLGFAPNSWSSLLDAMTHKGFSEFELVDAGLAKRGQNGGFYDAFRNRLMFPVIDVRGNVIGFSGRILDDGEPKYLNSPETLVFSKSRNLFALNLAKKSKSGYIILTEGNIDVVSLHQSGFDSAVASLGTSLTQEQARIISRYTNQVIIAYDNDNAGIKASQRAIGILEKLDLSVRVLRMSGAKDPDEFIKLKGADAFRNLLDASENQVDYRLRSVKDKYDLSADDQRVAFLKEATELVASLQSAPERQVYSKRVAELASVSGEVISDEAERLHKKLVSKAHSGEMRKAVRPETLSQPVEKSFRYANPASAVAEEGIIRLLYLEPELITQELPDKDEFSSPVLGNIFSVISDMLAHHRLVNTTTLSEFLTQKEMELVVSILQKPEILSNSRSSLRDYITRIRNEKTSRDFSAIIESKQNTAYDKVKRK